jgi:hypothetical protein
VNSGSIVAGIVGTKKFAYDIWGDTVIASWNLTQLQGKSIFRKIHFNWLKIISLANRRNSSKKQGHDENVLC